MAVDAVLVLYVMDHTFILPHIHVWDSHTHVVQSWVQYTFPIHIRVSHTHLGPVCHMGDPYRMGQILMFTDEQWDIKHWQ